MYIIKDCFGEDLYRYKEATDAYQFVNDALLREYGLLKLNSNDISNYDVPFEIGNANQEAMFRFFLENKNVDQVIDVIELVFKVIDCKVRKCVYQHSTITKISSDDAINELNRRLMEHGIGYQFESGEIVKVDSKYIHSEVVKPALKVLQDKIYEGANDEFLKAHEHYRHSRNKEAINECLKSLESVMKAICDKHKWKYNQNDAVKKLIDICLTNNLVPKYMQSQFTSLRLLLESGVPTVRNRLGGHGQGTTTKKVGACIASYALHLTAANILFLAENETKLK